VISHIFCFLSFVFVISSSLNDSVCFDFPSLCGVFLISRLSAVFFYSGWKISFEQVQIRSMTMTLASSTLQIRRHEYFGDIIIIILVIFVGIGILPFYAINMDVVSLFTDSSFFFLANLDLYYIDVLYQFEWINIVYFCQKKDHFSNMMYITGSIWIINLKYLFKISVIFNFSMNQLIIFSPFKKKIDYFLQLYFHYFLERHMIYDKWSTPKQISTPMNSFIHALTIIDESEWWKSVTEIMGYDCLVSFLLDKHNKPIKYQHQNKYRQDSVKYWHNNKCIHPRYYT